jgi:RNA polymerase sigma-70 factor (ECF subfamily)
MIERHPEHSREGYQTDTSVCDLHDINALVRNHGASVSGYALRCLRNKDLAETVTQDCLLKAFRSRDCYRGECAVRTWLMKIAKNLIRDHTRTARFRFWNGVNITAIEVGEIHDRVASPQLSPEANLLVRERMEQAWYAINKLPKLQREIVLMRFIEQMKLSEIASTTRMSLSTVKNNLYRGLVKIRFEARGTRHSEPRGRGKRTANLVKV